MGLGLDPRAFWQCEDEAEHSFLVAVVLTAQRQQRQAQQVAELQQRAKEHGG